MNLKFPSKDYGNLHIKMALSLDKFNDYLKSLKNEDLEESLSYLDEVKTEYEWLED